MVGHKTICSDSHQTGVTFIRTAAAQIYGFMFDENRNLIINEKEAKWIRVIFEMYADGHNSAEIADLLERNGVKTLTGLDRWSPSSIRKIIRLMIKIVNKNIRIII